MRRPRVVVFYGGDFANHDLSSETGQWVCSYIPRSKYDVTPVEVTSDGLWKVPLGNLPRSGSVGTTLQRLSEALPALPPAQALNRLLDRPVDSVTTLVRGQGGDDGALHGLGQIIGAGVMGSPYSTCKQTSDKFLFTKSVEDVAHTPYTRRFSRKQGVDAVVAEIQRDFLSPIFVKPASQEGSFGIERIENPSELRTAIQRIFMFDNVIVQEYVPGTEFSVSLTKDARGKIQTLPTTAIVPQHTNYYDHLAKRRGGRVALHTPNNQDNPVIREVEEIARDVYEELDCNGLVTLDMVAGDDTISVLEANVVPTLSSFTPLKDQLKAASLHPTTLLTALIAQSLEQKP